MKKLIVLILIGVFFAGCSFKSHEEILLGYHNECHSYGFNPGTDIYSNCVMQMSQKADERAYQKRQDMANSLKSIGDNWQVPNYQQTFNNGLSGYRNKTTCTSRSNGSTGAFARIITDCQ